MVDEYNNDVHFVEIDIEEDQEIAEAAGIMGTPCVQFFKNKEMLRLGCVLALIGLFIVMNYCDQVWIKMTCVCRTISGVKMKKEYRELIEANK